MARTFGDIPGQPEGTHYATRLHYARQLEARGETVRALILTPTFGERDRHVWKSIMQDAGVASRSQISGDDP